METYVKEIEDALLGVLSKFKEEIKGIRSNRPSTELLEGIRVNCYDSQMPINQVGTLSVGGAREIIISVWDKTIIPAVMSAIQEANVGFSLRNDGMNIIASLPALSEERRQEFMKMVKRISEDFKIQIRNKREESMKKLKGAEDSGEITEDMVFKGKELIQKVVDKYNAEIDKNLEAKIKELGE
jgi:ribosome recycling factor